MSNSVSSLSIKSRKRRTITTENATKPGGRCKRDAQDDEQEDAEEDYDNEVDMFPVTDGAHSLGTLTEEESRAAEQREAAVVEAHHQEFMRRAFPPPEKSPMEFLSSLRRQ